MVSVLRVRFLFPCLECGVVRVVRGELRVERREGVLEGCRGPAEAVFC